jgi:hypothetical protein
MSASDPTEPRHEHESESDLPAPAERKTGRPTGPTDEDGLRPGQTQPDAPTEAPEERGAAPATEHAPGGDL